MRSPKNTQIGAQGLANSLATMEEVYWETGVTRWSEGGGGGKFPESKN